MDSPFITVNGDCYEWSGPVFQSGYGRIKVSGVTHRAHRAAWEFAHGPIPDGKIVMHTCDNRRCVRVDHLRLGTHVDNMADMVAKGRASKNERRVYESGEANANAVLTDDEVAAIRARYDAGGTSQVRLADEYGVSQTLISRIVRGLHRPG